MTPSYPFSLTHMALFSKVMVMECTWSALSVEERKEKREGGGEGGRGRETWTHRNENEWGSKSHESYEVATGRVTVRKDSCGAQEHPGLALSLGFISCKEMGRERKAWLPTRGDVLQLLLAGVRFQCLNLHFLSPLPTHLSHSPYAPFASFSRPCHFWQSQQCSMGREGRKTFAEILRYSLDWDNWP